SWFTPALYSNCPATSMATAMRMSRKTVTVGFFCGGASAAAGMAGLNQLGPRQGTLPLKHGILGQAEVLEQPRGELRDHRRRGLGAIVKRGGEGENGRASLVGREKVAQVDAVQGRLANRQDQPPPLLEADVGGALD